MISRKRVVLPAPFGPIIPTIPLGGNMKLRLSNKSFSPNAFATFLASITLLPKRGPFGMKISKFPVLPIVLGLLLPPNKYEAAKMRPYECGIDPQTEAHDRFTVRYYIVAMLFLVFDVETIFQLPWAVIYMGADFSFTKFALVEILVFIGILVVGYYYAWRKGALEWA